MDNPAPAVAQLLSDQWGATYAQIVVTLIVFALGIPAILIQTITAPEIHRIASARRKDGSHLLRGFMAICVIITFLGLLLYHSSKPRSVGFDDRTVGLIIAALVGGTVGLWWRHLKLPARERLFRALVKDAVVIYRKRRSIPDDLVADLLDLATGVSRRNDRHFALDRLRWLIVSITSTRRYRGESLDEVLSIIPMIAADPTLPLYDDNVLLGGRILLESSEGGWNERATRSLVDIRASQLHPSVWKRVRRTWDTLGQAARKRLAPVRDRVRIFGSSDPEPVPPVTFPNKDSVAAIRAYLRLLEAVTLRASETSETTVRELLENLVITKADPISLPAKGLFQIGRLALRSDRNQLALICISHLEDLVEHVRSRPRTDPEETAQDQEVVESFIGLVAHVCAKSPSAIDLLRRRSIIAELLESRTRLDLNSSVEFFLDQSDFETVDHLMRTSNDLRPSLDRS